MVLVSEIISKAQKTLLDENEVRWTVAELLEHLNSGIKAIVANKPDTTATTLNVAVDADSAYQTIPDDGLQLVDVVGISDGPAIRHIERGHLDNLDPNWRQITGIPQHFTHDPRNPKGFYLFPVPTGQTFIELVYSKIPNEVVLTDELPIDDIYDSVLHNWVVAYAYMKNTKRGDLQKSMAYLNMFNSAIGLKTQAQIPYSPRPPEEQRGTER